MGLFARPVRLLLVAFALAGCASAAKAADEVTPVGGGATRYFAPPAQGSGERALTDALARNLAALVTRLSNDGPAPRPDLRLTGVADTLAGLIGPDEVPGLELQEFLLSHFGLGEPLPELAMFQFGMDDETILDKYAATLPQILRGGPFGRIGVGIKRRFLGRTSVVLALQRIEIELLPIPRRMQVGESALIGGQLLGGRRDPLVLVAPPRGEVKTLPVRATGDSFRTSFKCDAGVGRYQVEIFGQGAGGKAVVANFPVFCGLDPPRSAPRTIVAGPETTDVREAERLAFAGLNRDRVEAGLPALVWDEGLARAARGHSEELARRKVVAHLSRESGNALDRVRQAGVTVMFLRENVGRANSLADAQKSFMSSPGHRANILARGVSRGAVGVVLRKSGGGAGTVYVTQLFAR